MQRAGQAGFNQARKEERKMFDRGVIQGNPHVGDRRLPKSIAAFANASAEGEGHSVVIVKPNVELSTISVVAAWTSQTATALMKKINERFGKLIRSKAIEGLHVDSEIARDIIRASGHIAGFSWAWAPVRIATAREQLCLLVAEMGDSTLRVDAGNCENKDLLDRARESLQGSVFDSWALGVWALSRDLEDYDSPEVYKIEGSLNWD